MNAPHPCPDIARTLIAAIREIATTAAQASPTRDAAWQNVATMADRAAVEFSALLDDADDSK